MGVEAARLALAGSAAHPERLYFATTSLPYLDKTNASVIHAALSLDSGALAVDMAGAPRSAIGAILAAADASVQTLVVLADTRTGLPGSEDERDGGDASAALVFGEGTDEMPALATIIGTSSTTDEFLERWRTPGSNVSRTWEARFGEHVYGPLVDHAFAAALKAADLLPSQIDHLVVCGLASRATKQFAKSSGVPAEAVLADLCDAIGNPGAAQPGLLLSAALDQAEPGQTIALVQLADGASVILLRTTDAVATGRRSPGIVESAIAATSEVSYPTFLTWRGMLDREPPRRPEPDAPAGPPTYRSSAFKHSFRGTKCQACGTVNLPPSRVCYSCASIDTMLDYPMTDMIGTVATFTIDRLAFTPSPPMVAVVVDFDGGGRFRCELADTSPADVRIGMSVQLTFRRLLTADGVHNYFWKARPAAIPSAASDSKTEV
jgi:3-hydroxy-3-methylglutaryl CoA synthase